MTLIENIVRTCGGITPAAQRMIAYIEEPDPLIDDLMGALMRDIPGNEDLCPALIAEHVARVGRPVLAAEIARQSGLCPVHCDDPALCGELGERCDD